MRDPIATMITTTTYGTWLPGDTRGYVERGRLLPASPRLEGHARRLLKKDPVFLSQQERDRAFHTLLDAVAGYEYTLLAVTVESWHVHWLIVHHDEASAMVGRLKTAIRKALDRGRVWAAGYDARFCFHEDDVESRYEYIARHPGYRPLV